jgi:7-cyano-7-deazaguanine reductase
MAIFHEAAVNKIMNDLVEAIDPHWIEVFGDFNVRGNIKTIIRTSKGKRE